MRPRLTAYAIASLALGVSLTAQDKVPPAVQWVPATALQAKLQSKAPWLSLLERETMTVGRYRLTAGGKDGQQPHDRDEIYYVLAGEGQFTAAGETRTMTTGDLVFVTAGAEHRFHDIKKDLDLMVFFSTVTVPSGGMMAGPTPTEQTPYAETSARGSARIFYWYGPDSAGQLVLDHGRPRWNGGYQKFLDAPSNQRWRFGQNAWSTLDTNIPLTLGGVRIAPGQHYVVLQHREGHGLELVLLDPTTVRAQLLDAYEVSKTTGGITVPLAREEAPYVAGHLAVAFAVDRDAEDSGQLRIHFGPHLLLADLQMHPAREPSPTPTTAPTAAADDVASTDAIIAALYDVISGPAGTKRDWQRMRSLFHPEARLVPIGRSPGGNKAALMSVEHYIEQSGPFLERNGFFEQEIKKRTDRFGDFATVWSTYEGRRKLDDAEPFLRGINSIQLVREGGRWWVLQVLWQQESLAGPIPAEYLPGR